MRVHLGPPSSGGLVVDDGREKGVGGETAALEGAVEGGVCEVVSAEEDAVGARVLGWLSEAATGGLRGLGVWHAIDALEGPGSDVRGREEASEGPPRGVDDVLVRGVREALDDGVDDGRGAEGLARRRVGPLDVRGETDVVHAVVEGRRVRSEDDERLFRREVVLVEGEVDARGRSFLRERREAVEESRLGGNRGFPLSPSNSESFRDDFFQKKHPSFETLKRDDHRSGTPNSYTEL